MISDQDKQTLLSLKSSPQFLSFLSTSKYASQDHCKVLDLDFLYNDAGHNNFFSTFTNHAQQLNYKLLSGFNFLSQKSDDCFGQPKHESILSLSENQSTDADISAFSCKKRKNRIMFKVLKKEKQVNIKFSIRTDCIRKKVKSMFHKYVINKLNSLLSQLPTSSSFKPLAKQLSVNLNLKESKKWASMTLRELMLSSTISNSGYDTANLLNNKRIINEHKLEQIDDYLNKKWSTAFNEFLDSPEYSQAIKDMEKISKTYSERLAKHSSLLLSFIEH